MSIFGVKKTTDLYARVNDLHRRVVDRRLTELHKGMNTITVWAEKKGSLSKDVFEFGFGNAGRDDKTGYMMMCDGFISCMSLNVNKEFGRAWIKLAIDGQEQNDDYGILLTGEMETVSSYKQFDKPLKVKAGSIINFISKVANPRVNISVVCILINLEL